MRTLSIVCQRDSGTSRLGRLWRSRRPWKRTNPRPLAACRSHWKGKARVGSVIKIGYNLRTVSTGPRREIKMGPSMLRSSAKMPRWKWTTIRVWRRGRKCSSPSIKGQIVFPFKAIEVHSVNLVIYFSIYIKSLNILMAIKALSIWSSRLLYSFPHSSSKAI